MIAAAHCLHGASVTNMTLSFASLRHLIKALTSACTQPYFPSSLHMQSARPLAPPLIPMLSTCDMSLSVIIAATLRSSHFDRLAKFSVKSLNTLNLEFTLQHSLYVLGCRYRVAVRAHISFESLTSVLYLYIHLLCTLASTVRCCLLIPFASGTYALAVWTFEVFVFHLGTCFLK